MLLLDPLSRIAYNSTANQMTDETKRWKILNLDMISIILQQEAYYNMKKSVTGGPLLK